MAEQDPPDSNDSPPENPLDDDSIPESVKQKLETFVPELVRRAFTAGMGAVFTTEEGIRKITRDMPLPKEVAGYLANTAGATKDEVFRVLAKEVREFLESVNLGEEIAKMLTTLSLEVKTEIRFIPNDQKYGGVEPDVKAAVKLKRNGKDVDDSETDAEGKQKRRRRLTLRGSRDDD